MPVSDFQVVSVAIPSQFDIHVSDVKDLFFTVSGGNAPLAEPLVPSVWFGIIGRMYLAFGILEEEK